MEECYQIAQRITYMNCCNTLKRVREMVAILPQLIITEIYLMKGRKWIGSMIWTTSLVLPIIQKFHKLFKCCQEIWIQLRIDLSHYLPPKNTMEIDFIADENFHIFTDSIEQFSVLKTISANCLCKTVFQVAKNKLWLNRIFLILADKNGKPCLTIDCRVINPNGPAKIRTKLTVRRSKFVILI